MSIMRKKFLDLLLEEIELVQIEELLEKAGEHHEASCVKAERDQIFKERMILKERMRFRAVDAS